MEKDYAETKECRLSLAVEEFYVANFAFVLRKNSPLQTIFNKKYVHKEYKSYSCSKAWK